MRTLLVAVVVSLTTSLVAPGPVGAVGAVGASAESRSARAECRRTLPAYPEIEPGTTSRAVRTLQCVLNDAGWGPIAVDGFYGPQTRRAVGDFTDNFECCITRPLRVRTWYWTILFSQSRRLRGLELGDSGIRVKTLQRALRADGEQVVVDADFGPQTKAAVKAFQAKCQIRQSGRVNDQTAFFFSQGGCGA